ncbi:importin subunit alpha-1-like [Olea europaea var. sylvestris]|uniref:importin subunit alpha-1-like n=1 Tax=Olea europaea var. sylvestris TaxID=158386 RepID=UPI000C1D0A34|nr:importin subunit alpha-1-like [Olea europaea var. sylvestris]
MFIIRIFRWTRNGDDLWPQRLEEDATKAVIEASFISPLLELLRSAEFGIKRQAAWVISNATSWGTQEQIKFLMHEGCIKPLYDLLVSPNEVETIKCCLAGLENILKVGEAEKHQDNAEDVNVFAQMIRDARGLQKIKNLQTHDDGNIREKAVKMLETYWQEEDDERLYSGNAPQFECICWTVIVDFFCFLPNILRHVWLH